MKASMAAARFLQFPEAFENASLSPRPRWSKRMTARRAQPIPWPFAVASGTCRPGTAKRLRARRSRHGPAALGDDAPSWAVHAAFAVEDEGRSRALATRLPSVRLSLVHQVRGVIRPPIATPEARRPSSRSSALPAPMAAYSLTAHGSARPSFGNHLHHRCVAPGVRPCRLCGVVALSPSARRLASG